MMKFKIQPFLLWAIGLSYIGYFLFLGAANLFGAALSCWGSCNELTPAFRGEAYVLIAFLLAALSVFPKFIRGESWARIVFILLGLVIISNSLLIFYTTGFSSLENTLTNGRFWIYNLPFIFGSIYLLVMEFTEDRAVDLKNILLAVVICSLIAGLQTWNIYNQHITLKAYYDRQRMGQTSGSLKLEPIETHVVNSQLIFMAYDMARKDPAFIQKVKDLKLPFDSSDDHLHKASAEELFVSSVGADSALPEICDRLSPGVYRSNAFGTFFLHNECLWYTAVRRRDPGICGRIDTGAAAISGLSLGIHDETSLDMCRHFALSITPVYSPSANTIDEKSGSTISIAILEEMLPKLGVAIPGLVSKHQQIDVSKD